MKDIKENGLYFKEDVLELLSYEKEMEGGEIKLVKPAKVVDEIFASKDFPKVSLIKRHFITGRALLDYLSQKRF